MVYYRLAYLKPQTTQWYWKTTVLLSLQAVFQWLRIYSFLPQDQLRVFSAPSKKNLEEMLQRENRGLPSGSITAAQFLRTRHIQVHNVTESTSIQETTEQKSCSSTPFAAHIPAYKNGPMLVSPNEKGMSVLDWKRLEIEWGPGGDHDIPYRFSLPSSPIQLLAWIRLLRSARAQPLQQ